MTDISKLRINVVARDQEIDPIKIFASRTQRGSIEGLYGPQQEALTSWHLNHRGKNDVMFSLPTGGGKTLVGLLAAQSLVNETRGKVFYACATNQLIEQARSQAEECGIEVSTYFERRWHNEDGFERGHTFLLTNYHALFNGRSRFSDTHIKGVVFDDAHVAPNIIRDCFTVTLTRQHPAWVPLLQSLQPYFVQSAYYNSFRKIQVPGEGYESAVLFVPTWFIIDNLKNISAALEDYGAMREESTKFSFTHIRHHLNQCCFFIAHNRIEIGPTILPTHTHPCFSPSVRRLYMTATLPSRYECIRTFGVSRAEPIIPTGKAGAAQRLFIFAKGESESELPFAETRRLAEPRKACIIVPSTKAAEKWQDLAKVYDSKEGHFAIRQFAQAQDNRKLVLAALYDGIDLPGKSCNVLILDGLPRGAFLHDSFREDALDVLSLKGSSIATRIVQSIGRIFRSNTDHGVVILADRFQQTWLVGADHLPYIPALLQQQILLGYEIRKLVDSGAVKYEELIAAVIDGRSDWDAFYNTEIGKIAAERKPKESKWGDALAQAEYEAFRHLWDGRSSAAAEALRKIAQDIQGNEKPLAAWFLHWAGLATKLAGEADAAERFFNQAANVKNILGRVVGKSVSGGKAEPGPQAIKIAALWSQNLAKLNEVLNEFKSDGGPNAEAHESALRELGNLLGFEASRPDKESGTGPDVLWTLPDNRAVVSLEAKTQKTNPKAYKKKVIGKLHDDVTWLDSNRKQGERRISIIGPLVPVVKQANPKLSYRVTPLSEFQALAARVTNAYQTVAAAAPGSEELAAEIEIALRFYGLVWPDCLDGMNYRFAVDLQEDIDDESIS